MSSEICWWVYVLVNEAGTTYTGIAKNIEGRLALHNSGKGAKFTRGRGPWHVLHQEGPRTRGDALRRELAIKADSKFKAGLKLQMPPSGFALGLIESEA